MVLVLRVPAPVMDTAPALPPIWLVPRPAPPLAVMAPVTELLVPVMVMLPALRPPETMPVPRAPPLVVINPLTVAPPWEDSVTLPPVALVAPLAVIAPVLRPSPAALLVT